MSPAPIRTNTIIERRLNRIGIEDELSKSLDRQENYFEVENG